MNDKIYVQIGDKKREANAKEIAQIEKDRAEYEAQAAATEAEFEAKAAARASALAKLDKLGLTEAEINAL